MRSSKVTSKLASAALSLLVCSSAFSATTTATEKLPAQSIGIRSGSIGWGFEYSVRAHPHLDFRAVWQTLSPGRFVLELDNPALNVDRFKTIGQFQSFGVIADWHPWQTPIHFSAGLLRNQSEFRVEPEQNPNSPLQYSARFDQFSYFLGAGWTSLTHKFPLALSLDVGMLAQQQSRLNWRGPSDALSDDNQASQIWLSRSAIETAFEDYKFLPVLMVGLSYRFGGK